MNTSEHLHPRSLRIFFMTEMWERYGFYVIQTLLILYLTYHFHWSDKRAFELVGTFTALTYISPFIGGWIADHFIGQRRAVLLATLVLFTSYIILTFFSSKHGLVFALAGIAVGTGLLKPNISSLLGNEYPLNSPKRENGFTIFYMGITTGIILGSILPMTIQRHFGWPMAFLSAAIGIVFALLIFSLGVYQYKILDYQPYHFQRKKIILTVIYSALLFFGSLLIFRHPDFANLAFSLIVLCSIAYVIRAAIAAEGQQRYQNIIIGLLCVISSLFWAFYFQMFSSYSLLITRIVQPTLFGITFPAPFYVAVQSVGMIVFGFVFAKMRHHKNRVTQARDIGRKFLIAMCVMTAAYALTILILHFQGPRGLISPLLIIPVYLLISVAELLLSPVGLAAITLLSSPERVSTMMGIFFVSLGTGGFLSGKIATLAAMPAELLPIDILAHHYEIAFLKMFTLLTISTFFCYLIFNMIKRLLTHHEQKLSLVID